MDGGAAQNDSQYDHMHEILAGFFPRPVPPCVFIFAHLCISNREEEGNSPKDWKLQQIIHFAVSVFIWQILLTTSVFRLSQTPGRVNPWNNKGTEMEEILWFLMKHSQGSWGWCASTVWSEETMTSPAPPLHQASLSSAVVGTKAERKWSSQQHYTAVTNPCLRREIWGIKDFHVPTRTLGRFVAVF